MMNTTQITIIGNVGQEPELRYTPTGTAVATLSVAVAQRRFDRESGGWQDKGTTWYRVNIWRDMAEHVAATVKRGMRVIVVGSLESRDWTNGDKSGTAWEISADGIGPDLAFATADVRRAARDTVPPPDDPWAGRDVLPEGAKPDTTEATEPGKS